jgi:hypothetical protein
LFAWRKVLWRYSEVYIAMRARETPFARAPPCTGAIVMLILVTAPGMKTFWYGARVRLAERGRLHPEVAWLEMQFMTDLCELIETSDPSKKTERNWWTLFRVTWFSNTYRIFDDQGNDWQKCRTGMPSSNHIDSHAAPFLGRNFVHRCLSGISQARKGRRHRFNFDGLWQKDDQKVDEDYNSAAKMCAESERRLYFCRKNISRKRTKIIFLPQKYEQRGDKESNFVENAREEIRAKMTIRLWKHIEKAMSTRWIVQEGRGNTRGRRAEISNMEKEDRSTSPNSSTHVLQGQFVSGYGIFEFWWECHKGEARAATLVKM